MLSNHEIIKELYVQLSERLRQFHMDPSTAKMPPVTVDVEELFETLKRQFDTRILFGNDVEQGVMTDCEHNSLQLIRIISQISVDLDTATLKEGAIQEIVSSTVSKSNLPDWLKSRATVYLPLLLFRQLSASADAASGEDVILILSGKAQNVSLAELSDFKRENPPKKFEIYIEYTDRYELLVMGRAGLFRAGDYHPFKILSLFLHRIGQSLTYREIYELAIRPGESTPPRDPSKKVYDYLKMIRQTLINARLPGIYPDEWFVRDFNQGLIHVSAGIESCLITTPDRLLI